MTPRGAARKNAWSARGDQSARTTNKLNRNNALSLHRGNDACSSRYPERICTSIVERNAINQYLAHYRKIRHRVTKSVLSKVVFCSLYAATPSPVETNLWKLVEVNERSS